MRERLRDKFSSFIKSKKMRLTPERFAILDKVLEQKPLFDIEDLYKETAAEFHVAKSTVYNTVDLLCACNIIRRNRLNNNKTVFELTAENHLNLICLLCGAVKTVKDEATEAHLSSLKFRGFNISHTSTNIYGICSTCARKQRKN